MNNENKSADFPTLWKTVERLESASIPYMLTGSLAMNFYGHARATNDIDIVIQVGQKDVSKIVGLFEGDFYISQDAVDEAIRRKSMFNVIDNESIFKVDFIVAKDDAISVERFSRREKIEVGPHSLSVITAEDLILSKLEWSKDSLSELQRRDVENIVRISSNSLDVDYLRARAKQCGVYDALKEIYESVGHSI